MRIVIVDSSKWTKQSYLMTKTFWAGMINSYIMITWLLLLMNNPENHKLYLTSIARIKRKRCFGFFTPTGRQIITSDFLTSIQLKSK